MTKIRHKFDWLQGKQSYSDGTELLEVESVVDKNKNWIKAWETHCGEICSLVVWVQSCLPWQPPKALKSSEVIPLGREVGVTLEVGFKGCFYPIVPQRPSWGSLHKLATIEQELSVMGAIDLVVTSNLLTIGF